VRSRVRGTAGRKAVRQVHERQSVVAATNAGEVVDASTEANEELILNTTDPKTRWETATLFTLLLSSMSSSYL